MPRLYSRLPGPPVSLRNGGGGGGGAPGPEAGGDGGEEGGGEGEGGPCHRRRTGGQGRGPAPGREHPDETGAFEEESFGGRCGPMAIRGHDIVAILKQQIEQFGAQAALVDVGTVVEVGDGIARIHGLQGARYNELLEFANGTLGIALNLEEDSVGAIVLGDYSAIKEGEEVRTTGRIVEVPGGDGLKGRVGE